MEPAQLTLREAVTFFSDYQICHNFMVQLRWPDGRVTCPRCGSDRVVYLANQRKWKCYAKHEKPFFTLKTGTVFEDSPISMDKWIVATWQIVNCRNGISSWELHRALGVTQKTAWFMLHRVRLAVQDDLTGGMLNGEIEVDESNIGGKIRNMHKQRRLKVQREANSQKGDKAIVLGIIERASDGKKKRVRATVVPDRKKDTVQREVSGVVDKGATIYSDELAERWKMEDRFVH